MVEENVAKGELQNVAVQRLEGAALDTLMDLLNTVGILENYLNDQVVQDLSKIASPVFKLINAISATDLVDIIERGLQDPGLDKALLDPPRVGFVGLLRALGSEEVQRGMGIMIELLRAIGKASVDR